MPTTASEPGPAIQIEEALADLKAALARASDATARLKSLMPEVTSAGTVLDQIAALVAGGAHSAPRPIAATPPPQLGVAPESHDEPEQPRVVEADGIGAEIADAAPNDIATTCFRIEFENTASPLDLRTVDDAISAHPAVRDVALLDYDGRRAALKVWITSDATPAEVQSDLQQRAPQLFTPRDEISIVALEDVA